MLGLQLSSPRDCRGGGRHELHSGALAMRRQRRLHPSMPAAHNDDQRPTSPGSGMHGWQNKVLKAKFGFLRSALAMGLIARTYRKVSLYVC